MSVNSAIGEYDNPFLETSSDILVLDTRDIVEKSGVYNVYRMESQGCQQYYNLYANGSCSHGEEQYTLNPHKRQGTTSSGLVSSLKSDRNLFSRLFVASQSRSMLVLIVPLLIKYILYYIKLKQTVMVTSMIISHTRINHVPHYCQPEGNANWAPTDIVPMYKSKPCLEDAPEKQDDITPSVDVVMLDGPAMWRYHDDVAIIGPTLFRP